MSCQTCFGILPPVRLGQILKQVQDDMKVARNGENTYYERLLGAPPPPNFVISIILIFPPVFLFITFYLEEFKADKTIKKKLPHGSIFSILAIPNHQSTQSEFLLRLLLGS